MARQVWKPLEWAEMPRIACIDTGRPLIVSCRRPAQSVHATGSSIACSKATCASSAAIAADGVGGDAAAFGDRIGRIALLEIALGDELEDRNAAAAIDLEVAGQRRLCTIDRRR